MPDRNFLAVERSRKYHRLCCDRVARRGLTNVRLIRTTGEDLLFRLNTHQVRVPPLRERLSDVPLLAEHFLNRITDGPTGVICFTPGTMLRTPEAASVLAKTSVLAGPVSRPPGKMRSRNSVSSAASSVISPS